MAAPATVMTPKNASRLADIAFEEACKTIIRISPCEVETTECKRSIYNEMKLLIPFIPKHLTRYVHNKDEHRVWMIIDLLLRLIELSATFGFKYVFRSYCKRFRIVDACELILTQSWIWNMEPHDGAHIVINFIENIEKYPIKRRNICPKKYRQLCYNYCASKPNKSYPYLLFTLCTYCCE